MTLNQQHLGTLDLQRVHDKKRAFSQPDDILGIMFMMVPDTFAIVPGHQGCLQGGTWWKTRLSM